MDAMLAISNGEKRRNSVPKEVHESLAKKVYDSNNPLRIIEMQHYGLQKIIYN